MVSRKEVAAAIQAAAESCGVTPEELGRLSAFLLEMPKKHLDFAPIGADKAVVAFVRARYQAKASLGMGSTAGAGAVAGVGTTSALADGEKVFNNITVFILGCYGGYVKCDYPKLTKSQFEKKMARQRCACVVPVDAQPSQILALEDCADAAVDIDDVQLHDGMRLAVVASRGAALVSTIRGWTDGRTAADAYQAAEWAMAHLAGDEGARRWYSKTITGLDEGCQLQIEIDGAMAYSMQRVVLVERRPRINLVHVATLTLKMRTLEQLVAAGAPNTDVLRDSATGLIKPLEVFLMADGWADDQVEAAACAVRMEEWGIAPLLPTGDGGYAVRDSCGWWPVNDSTRQRAQRYLKPGRQPQSGGAATDAGAGSGGGGAAGPNSAVGIGRHPSSQQAACSPAPAHHLRAHDPFRAAGVCVRRRVALVCCPLHPHPQRQHHSSMPSVRRL